MLFSVTGDKQKDSVSKKIRGFWKMFVPSVGITYAKLTHLDFINKKLLS